MALFLNIFIVTSNSPVSIYRSICSCSHCFPACYRGTTCGKADHPWQPYLVRGDHLRQHNLPQMVRGDQLWRGTNYGVTVPSTPTIPSSSFVVDVDGCYVVYCHLIFLTTFLTLEPVREPDCHPDTRIHAHLSVN